MDVMAFVEQLKKNIEKSRSKVTFIGVAGGSASGKTSITEIIARYFQDSKSVSVVNVDLFYRDLTPELEQKFSGQVNWDDPCMIDHEELFSCLNMLKQRKPYKLYDFDYKIAKHDPNTEIIINPAEIIIVEGIFAFYWPEIRDMEKLRIFVDCSGEYRLMRRIVRDTKERGRTVDNIIEQYSKFVKPSFDKYIAPQKKVANLVLPWENVGENTNLEAVELLINYISVLSDQSSRPSTPFDQIGKRVE